MSARLQKNEPVLVGSRYRGAQIVEFEGRLELEPREIVELRSQEKERFGYFYTVQQGDRIDALAFTLMGDSRLWWLLADLNVSVAPDPQYLPVGEMIFIPHANMVNSFL